MKPWVCEGVAKDGGQHSNQSPPGPHEPYENYGEDCVICNLTREQVVGGGTKSKGGSGFPVKNLAVLGLAALFILGAGWFLLPQVSELIGFGTVNGVQDDSESEDEDPGEDPPTSQPDPDPNQPISERQGLYSWEPERYTWGHQTLFSGDSNVPRDEGIEAFREGDYRSAANSFRRAVSGNRNDPEVLIFYNNALARQQGSPYTLAVVVPVDGRSNSAKEMLRGVAQAQNQFNDSNGVDGRLLEIVIANDGNKPENATQVAEEIIKDESVLGVIGHNSSSASEAGLEIYEEAGLPIVSPTSTSTALDSDVFFRTVPSDAVAAEKLAQYAREEEDISKAVVFYNPEDSFSSSLQSAFEERFAALGGESLNRDMTDSDLDAGIEVSRASGEDDAEALLLFPNTDYIRVAIELARANSKLSEDKKLLLLGGDSLYGSDTVIGGGDGTEGLVIPVPWFSGAQQFESFSKASEERWGGLVSWRTAMSFDAAQAFIKSLSDDDMTRATVLNNLEQVSLADDEASGQAFRFTQGGERGSAPVLVRVVRGKNTVPGSEFGYELVAD